MKQWMKQLSRILVLTLAVVCLCGYLSLEADAYPTVTYNGSSHEWKSDAGGEWLAYKSGGYVYDSWITYNGDTYFAQSNGYILRNGGFWIYTESTKQDEYYYFWPGGQMAKSTWITDYYVGSNGIMYRNKWDPTGVYYCGPNGSYLKNAWVPPGDNANAWKSARVGADGKRLYSTWVLDYTYYIKPNGEIATSWYEIGGKQYCFADDGLKRTGWETTSGTYTYYLDPSSSPSGQMVVNAWKTIGGKDYHFDAQGHLEKNKWVGSYYVGSDGAKANGWVTISGDGTYYFTNGVKKTGLQTNIGGEIYYFDSNGRQFTSGGWQGEYYFRTGTQTNGKAYKSAWVDGNKSYVDGNGKKVYNWQTIDGSSYYFGSNGVKCTGTQTINNKYYYFDPTSGVQQSNGWKADGRYYKAGTGADAYALTNTWTPDEYWVNSDGKKVTNSWVDGNQYYVDGNGKKANGWVTISGDGTYYFVNGVKKTGLQTIDSEIYLFGDDGRQYTAGGWQSGYYFYTGTQYDGRAYRNSWTPDEYWVDSNGKCVYNSVVDSEKYYVGADGHKVYDQVVNDGTTNYYAQSNGILSTDYHLINPYFDYVVGGLYGANESQTDLHYATEVYSANVNQPIDLEYTQLSIGAKPASSITVVIPDGYASTGVTDKWNEWGTPPTWAWNEAAGSAFAWAENRDALCNGGMYAIYHNIATLNGKSIDLKLSIVDYATLYGWGEEPILAFNEAQGGGIPGVLALGISWVQLKYEFLDHETHALIDGDIKGNTTYYDVDNYQSICFNGDTDKKIYVSDQCLLRAGTVTGNGVLNGNCVFLDATTEADETEGNKPIYGVTEIFEGSTLIRTFSFKSDSYKTRTDEDLTTDPAVGAAKGVGNGAIYNEGDPVPGGNLTISKTILPAQTKDFEFTIVLTNGENVIDLDAVYVATGNRYSSITFTDGRATIELSDKDTVTIKGIPAGLTYTVTEKQVNGYAADSTVVTGTIPYADTATAEFINRELLTLTVKKTVVDKRTNSDKTFEIYVNITKPDGTTIEETLHLANGGTKTYDNLPGGTTYTIDEADYSGEGYAVSGEVSNASLTENKTVTITNTQEERTLTVDKVVAGTDTAKDKEFTFILNVWYADGTEYITNREIKLKDATEPFAITLPKNAKYTVTETEESKAGFLVSGEVTTAAELTDNANVTITNRELLDLTVEKKVEGVTKETDKAFKFTVVYKTPGSAESVTEEFTLKDGQSKTFADLPCGTTYTVTEESDGGYTTTGIVNEERPLTQDTTVTVTNTAIEHKLIVGKTVIGDADAQKQDFTFTLKWKRAGSEVYTEQSFTLKHGGTAEFILPTGCTYEVTETQADGYLAPVVSENASVTGMTKDETVEFTNTQLVTLTLQKQVAGNMASKTQEFAFTVKLGTGVEANAVTGTATYDGGEYTVNLAHDQSVVFTVPYNTAYEITETDYSGDGYETEISGADVINGYTATGEANGETVIYKNSKGFAIPTGVGMAVLPFLGMIFFGAVAGALQLLGGSRKSRRGRYLN